MKKIITLLAVAAMALTASAQDYMFNNPSNQAYFGVRASLDISSPSSKPGKMYDNGAGFSVGGVYNTPIVANLYFEPGVSLYYDTWGTKTVDGSFRNFGMAVPLQFGYHFDFTPDLKVAVFTGPEVRYGFVNEQHISINNPLVKANDYVSVYGDDALFTRVDCAWRFGASLTYGHYYLGVSGSAGMVNLYQKSTDNASFHQNVVQFTLGYNF